MFAGFAVGIHEVRETRASMIDGCAQDGPNPLDQVCRLSARDAVAAPGRMKSAAEKGLAHVDISQSCDLMLVEEKRLNLPSAPGEFLT